MNEKWLFVLGAIAVIFMLFAVLMLAGCELQYNSAGNGKGLAPWSSSKIYWQGDTVFEDGLIFVCLMNEDSGDNPMTTPLTWQNGILAGYVGSPNWNAIGHIQY